MAQPIVFFDIAGPDDSVLRSFYSEVFDWTFDDGGQFQVAISSPIDATIRKDPAEKRMYIGVPDVAATLASIDAAGGSIDVPRFEVTGMVVLGLFRDPAGNPMGLVEMDGSTPVVP